jgi:hypothetical protein
MVSFLFHLNMYYRILTCNSLPKLSIFIPQNYFMRAMLFVIVLLAVSLVSGAQNTDCSKVKNGSFKQADEGQGEMIIIRKGKTQTEENSATGLKLSMDINWTSDCTYELKNVKVIKGVAPFPIFEDAVLYNEIIEVNNKSYRVRCWMSIAPDNKMEFTLLIL